MVLTTGRLCGLLSFSWSCVFLSRPVCSAGAPSVHRHARQPAACWVPCLARRAC